jgi:DNA-binding IclR family transcriptional regulator
MFKESKESEKIVDSVASALTILDCFETAPSLSLGDIHERTGINKTRIMRLAGTLRHMGYVTQDQATGRYALGPKVHSLGGGLSKSYLNIKVLLNSFMKEIVEETGETASFFVVHGFRRLCLVREESKNAVRYVINEGEERPLYKGAPSKALLAFLPEEQREAFLEHFSTMRKEYDADAFRRQIVETKERGYASSMAEVSPDSYSIAVPVFCGFGKFYAALAVSGPVSRYSEEKKEKILKTLSLYKEKFESLL